MNFKEGLEELEEMPIECDPGYDEWCEEQVKLSRTMKGGSTLRGFIIKKEKLVELMKDVEMPDEVLMAAEKILELPSMDFGKMTQKEADLISEPKD